MLQEFAAGAEGLGLSTRQDADDDEEEEDDVDPDDDDDGDDDDVGALSGHIAGERVRLPPNPCLGAPLPPVPPVPGYC